MNFVVKREGDIKDIYQFSKVIGHGSFGKVYKAKMQGTKELRAIKAIPKEKISDTEQFKNEVETLKTLDHPNVVKLFETFSDSKRVYMVMELCEGGELLERIIR